MAMRPSKKGPVRVSAELSTVIETFLNDPQRKAPLTLGEVRVEVEKTGLQWSRNGELLFPQDRTSQLIELDDLIERYGAETPALDLFSAKASAGPESRDPAGSKGKH
jgi:hypothetical protein